MKQENTELGLIEIERVDGMRIQLTSYGSFWYEFDEGFGIPGVKYITGQGPYQHGETLEDFRLSSRQFAIGLGFKSKNRDDYWMKRKHIEDMFKPSVEGFVIRVKNYMTTRELRNVVYDGGLDFSSNGRSGDPSGSIIDQVVIKMVAFDPVWFDPGGNSNNYATVAGASLVFPFSFNETGPDINIIFGSEGLYSASDIVYEGNWPSFPIMTLTGPMTYPSILNVSTGEKIELQYALISGETVVIDCTDGVKTIISSINGNIQGTLSSDSDFASFHIAPEPEVAGGINEITISAGDMISGESNILINYYDRYFAI